MNANSQRAVELLREAQENVKAAIENLQDYVQLTGNRSIERTLLASLEVLSSRDHQWLDRSENLDDLLDEAMLANEEAEADDDEDEDGHGEIDYAMLWESTNR